LQPSATSENLLCIIVVLGMTPVMALPADRILQFANRSNYPRYIIASDKTKMSSNDQIWSQMSREQWDSPPLSTARIIVRHAPGQVLEPGSPPSEAQLAVTSLHQRIYCKAKRRDAARHRLTAFRWVPRAMVIPMPSSLIEHPLPRSTY
jgi:hypothetical protein